jgi:hypothetical protein
MTEIAEYEGPVFEKRVFDPNNKAWANDQTGFGFKMLQKMGWSPGKGLGANEDGNLKNITLLVKNDQLGLGVKEDQIEKLDNNNQDFAKTLQLVANLMAQKNKAAPEKKIEKAEATEAKKKQHSHYIPKRVVQSRDVSKYSKEDLCSIFGVADEDDELQFPIITKKKAVIDDSFCVSSNVSSKDYFTNKMKKSQIDEEVPTTQKPSKIVEEKIEEPKKQKESKKDKDERKKDKKERKEKRKRKREEKESKKEKKQKIDS